MNLLRRTARWTSGLLGRDSRLINALRPAYNLVLDLSTAGRGVWQQFNGHEQFRIDPWCRPHFPEDKDADICRYLRAQVRPGAVCLNAGAHVGIYAFCLASWSGPLGRVVAFEPNPYPRAVLQRHLALNELTDRVEVVAQAVSDVVEEGSFFADHMEGYSRLGQPNPGARDRPHTLVKVPITTLDAFCRGRGLTPDWILLDVEGSEVAALAGGRAVIRAGRGRLGLIVELHPHLWEAADTSRGRLEGVLAELGLRPVPLTGQADPLGEYGIVRFDYV
jgi:FkbM family methyltransferase